MSKKFACARLASIAVVGAVISFSATAGLVNAGGVVWDPDWTDGTNPPQEFDFASEVQFTQYYTQTNSARRSLNYASAVTIGSVIGSLSGSSAATGFYLEGGGLLTRINDPLRSFNTGFGSAASFCPGCQVTYAFGGIGLNQDATFDVSSAWVQVYVDTTTLFTVPVNSQMKVNDLLDGDLWLDLNISTFELLFGATVGAGAAGGELEIIGGLAAGFFNPTVVDYFGSAFFGQTPGTVNPSARYSSLGNGQLFGDTTARVPEPATLLLVGAALLGVGASRRLVGRR